jgi:hypothetical protein
MLAIATNFVSSPEAREELFAFGEQSRLARSFFTTHYLLDFIQPLLTLMGSLTFRIVNCHGRRCHKALQRKCPDSDYENLP